MANTVDIPEGFIPRNSLVNNILEDFPDVLMDDTNYLMDDTVANMGGVIAITTSLPNGVILTKPTGK